jgi:hypothetical protein
MWKRLLAAGVLAALLGAAAAIASAENIDPNDDNSQFAWGENVGWINAEPSGPGGPGIQVSGAGLTGYMYGENIGWINLSCTNNNTCGTVSFGITNDGNGKLGGYAWGENVGWISFSCENNAGTCAGTGNYGVVIDKVTGIFSGYAWGENIGWISFSATTPVAYQVQTDDGDSISGATDNCPFDSNAAQEWSDQNFLDQTPPSLKDDRTWPNSDSTGDACDTDDDNDGLSDTDEASGAACSSIVTNPAVRDTDGDRFLDGAECALGTDPTSAASKPTIAQCAAYLGVTTTADADADRLRDHIEFCNYNTDPNDTDTDKDQDGIPTGFAKDGCEAASFNEDRVVTAADQILMAYEMVREISPSLRLVNMDINKDSVVSSADQLIMANFIAPPGQCP